MRIYPTYVAMNGIKEIELKNNHGISFENGIWPGIVFTREINIDLLLKAELHQQAYRDQGKAIDWAMTKIKGG